MWVNICRVSLSKRWWAEWQIVYSYSIYKIGPWSAVEALTRENIKTRVLASAGSLAQPCLKTMKGGKLIKGTVSRGSPKPKSIPLGPFRFFSKICGDIRSLRCTTGVVDTCDKSKKSSIRKFLHFFLHLWIVESTYRWFFFFKFTFRCQQSDSVPIICHRCHWQISRDTVTLNSSQKLHRAYGTNRASQKLVVG